MQRNVILKKRYSKEAEDIEGKFQSERTRKNSGDKIMKSDSEKKPLTFDKMSIFLAK